MNANTKPLRLNIPKWALTTLQLLEDVDSPVYDAAEQRGLRAVQQAFDGTRLVVAKTEAQDVADGLCLLSNSEDALAEDERDTDLRNMATHAAKGLATLSWKCGTFAHAS